MRCEIFTIVQGLYDTTIDSLPLKNDNAGYQTIEAVGATTPLLNHGVINLRYHLYTGNSGPLKNLRYSILITGFRSQKRR